MIGRGQKGAATAAMWLLLSIPGAACNDPHAPPAADRLDCARCHLAEYEAAAGGHEALGASTICYQCHGTSGWFPARSDAVRRHSEFPIETPAHAGYSCWQCHVDEDPEDDFNQPTTNFTCISCHAHTPGRTTPLHSGVSDYTYAAQSCFDCHPDGREDE